jgi:hypothetical protein
LELVPHALELALPVGEAVPVAVARSLFDDVGDTDADAHGDDVALGEEVPDDAGLVEPVAHAVDVPLDVAELVGVARKLFDDDGDTDADAVALTDAQPLDEPLEVAVDDAVAR